MIFIKLLEMQMQNESQDSETISKLYLIRLRNLCIFMILY